MIMETKEMNLKAEYKGRQVTIITIFQWDGGSFCGTKAAFVDRDRKIRTDLIANFKVVEEGK